MEELDFNSHKTIRGGEENPSEQAALYDLMIYKTLQVGA